MTRLMAFSWWVLARDIRHLLDRRNLPGVTVKLTQLQALLDSYRPAVPDPSPTPVLRARQIAGQARWAYWERARR